MQTSIALSTNGRGILDIGLEVGDIVQNAGCQTELATQA